MTKEQFFQSIEKSFADAFEILRKKNNDYAGEKTIEPFKNFQSVGIIGVDVAHGIMVRMCDKMTRAGNLLKQESAVKDEKLEDTLLNLINYTAILKAYLESQQVDSLAGALVSLQKDIQSYRISLKMFIELHAIEELIRPMVDHCAIKAVDTREFEALLEQYRPLSKRLSYIKNGNRRLATAELKQPIAFGDLGTTSCLEIMEPRLERIGRDVVGFEHAEIIYPSLERAEEVLRAKHISYEKQDNGSHSALVIRINEKGQELKFTKRPLIDIVDEQIRQGISIVL